MSDQFVRAKVTGLEYEFRGVTRKVEEAEVLIRVGGLKPDGTFFGRPNRDASDRCMMAQRFVFTTVADVRLAGWEWGASPKISVVPRRRAAPTHPHLQVVTR